MTTAHPGDLDLYEVAWLAGGGPRTAQTAVAALVVSGRVRVADPDGELQVVRRGAVHPVEAAVLDALGARAYRGTETLVFLVRADPRLAAVEEGLICRGMLARRRLAAVVRRKRRTRITAAGRRALRGLRRPGNAGLLWSDAVREVALHGLVHVPAGLPAALAEAPPPRWSFSRRAPVDSDVARIYSATATFGSGGFGAGGGGI